MYFIVDMKTRMVKKFRDAFPSRLDPGETFIWTPAEVGGLVKKQKVSTCDELLNLKNQMLFTLHNKEGYTGLVSEDFILSKLLPYEGMWFTLAAYKVRLEQEHGVFITKFSFDKDVVMFRILSKVFMTDTSDLGEYMVSYSLDSGKTWKSTLTEMDITVKPTKSVWVKIPNFFTSFITIRNVSLMYKESV